MNNLVIGSSGKIGFYYCQRTKLKNNIYISRKKDVKKKFLKFNFKKKIFYNFLKKKKK